MTMRKVKIVLDADIVIDFKDAINVFKMLLPLGI